MLWDVLARASLRQLVSRRWLMPKESQFSNDNTEENKRKALEALESRGSRHNAATAADVSLKTLMEWRRCDDQCAARQGRDHRRD